MSFTTTEATSNSLALAARVSPGCNPASDAALVWDSTRAFAVDGNESADGGVVGVWRSGGKRRGVGRWPSPRPAIPREDHS